MILSDTNQRNILKDSVKKRTFVLKLRLNLQQPFKAAQICSKYVAQQTNETFNAAIFLRHIANIAFSKSACKPSSHENLSLVMLRLELSAN